MDLAELERAVRSDPLNLDLRLQLYDARLAANLSGPLRDPVLPELPIPACLASLDCHFDSVRRRVLERSQLAAAHRFLVLTVGHIQAFELWRAQRVQPRPGAVVTAGAANRALRAAQRIRSAICREEERAARIKRREDPGIDEFKSRLAMVRLERGMLMASDPDGYAQKHVAYDERWRRDRGFVERLASALRHVERLKPSNMKVFETEAQGRGRNSTIEIEPDGIELEWQKCGGGWRRFSPRE